MLVVIRRFAGLFNEHRLVESFDETLHRVHSFKDCVQHVRDDNRHAPLNAVAGQTFKRARPTVQNRAGEIVADNHPYACRDKPENVNIELVFFVELFHDKSANQPFKSLNEQRKPRPVHISADDVRKHTADAADNHRRHGAGKKRGQKDNGVAEVDIPFCCGHGDGKHPRNNRRERAHDTDKCKFKRFVSVGFLHNNSHYTPYIF